MAFIPPPFPFPGRWPQIFLQPPIQNQWLTPATPVIMFGGYGAYAPQPPPVYSYPQQNPPQTSWTHLSMASSPVVPPPPSDHYQQQHEDQNEDEQEDSEFEYGFVLSDEWRDRFRSSTGQSKHQQQQKAARAAARKKAKQQKKQARELQRRRRLPSPMESELQQAAQIERQRTSLTPRQHELLEGDNSTAPSTAVLRLQQLETELDMKFDQFCDAFQPPCWPQDPSSGGM